MPLAKGELQEAVERKRDLVAEVVPNPSQGWDDWLIPKRRRLAERYAAGEVEIRVRFGCSRGEHPVGEFLAVMHRSRDPEGDGANSLELEAVDGLLGATSAQLKVDPVFIDPAQFVDSPKGIEPEIVSTTAA